MPFQTAIVSVAIAQSDLLSKEAYLVDRISHKNRDKMRHLKAICFIRPEEDSINALIEELREPKYGDYYLCKYFDI